MQQMLHFVFCDMLHFDHFGGLLILAAFLNKNNLQCGVSKVIYDLLPKEQTYQTSLTSIQISSYMMNLEWHLFLQVNVKSEKDKKGRISWIRCKHPMMLYHLLSVFKQVQHLDKSRIGVFKQYGIKNLDKSRILLALARHTHHPKYVYNKLRHVLTSKRYVRKIGYIPSHKNRKRWIFIDVPHFQATNSTENIQKKGCREKPIPSPHHVGMIFSPTCALGECVGVPKDPNEPRGQC